MTPSIRTLTLSGSLVSAAILLPDVLSAQGTTSGPAPGNALTPVKVYAASGAHRGEEFDAAAALGQGPGALLFVHDITRETAPIIRGLDEKAAEFGLLNFRSFTVLLAGDRTEGEAAIKRVSKAVQLRNPMTLSLDGAEGPGNYALARNATLTLVMVKGGKVQQSIGFTETGRKDLPRLTKAIEAVAGKLPQSLDERAKLLPDDSAALKKLVTAQWREVARLQRQLQKLRQRRQQQRMGGRGAGAQRGNAQRGKQGANRAKQGKLPGEIPEDAQLQGLLRRLIRVKTKAEIDALFTAIESAIGGKDERRAAMLKGFERILGGTTYGTDEARQRAVDYCKKHGKVFAVRKKG